MEFGILLRLVGVMNCKLIFMRYSKERTLLMWFCQQDLNSGLNSHIYRPISFKLGLMIETTKLYILIMWMTLMFFQVIWEIKDLNVHFLTNLGIDVNEIQFSVLKLIWNFLHNILFKGENSADVILCERICFKLGVMLNTSSSRLYCLISVWMTLLFT